MLAWWRQSASDRPATSGQAPWQSSHPPSALSISRSTSMGRRAGPRERSEVKRTIWRRLSGVKDSVGVEGAFFGSRAKTAWTTRASSSPSSIEVPERLPRRVCHSSVRSLWVTSPVACAHPPEDSGDKTKNHGSSRAVSVGSGARNVGLMPAFAGALTAGTRRGLNLTQSRRASRLNGSGRRLAGTSKARRLGPARRDWAAPGPGTG